MRSMTRPRAFSGRARANLDVGHDDAVALARDKFERTVHAPDYLRFRADSLENLLAEAGMVVVDRQLHSFSKVVIAQKC